MWPPVTAALFLTCAGGIIFFVNVMTGNQMMWIGFGIGAIGAIGIDIGISLGRKWELEQAERRSLIGQMRR